VCPLSVMANWEMQIAEHSGGALSCIRYHGQTRNRMEAADLAAADVVLTTYGIVATDKVFLKRV
jgi:SWI/SNF-related matrix-associated actin-dependent regulator of chromatin subfamily A3